MLIFAFLGIRAGHAQTVIIDEGFDDDDFINNPTWSDPEGKHIVNGLNRVQLEAPSATEEAVITTVSSAAYGEWEAFIRLDFGTSGGNLTKFYILSDTQSLKADVNGYFVMIGNTDDEISLYRQDGSSSTKIIDGTDKFIDADPVVVRVRVTRNLGGNWQLFADPAGGTSYVSQGTVSDNTYTSSNFIGFLSDYTSTRSDRFEYDDIIVTKVNPPLAIQAVTLQDNPTIDVQFNLDIDPASVDAADFSLDNGIGTPTSISLPSSDVIQLSYSSSLPSNEYTLTVNNVDDTDGNTIGPNSAASFILYGTFSPGDAIINEFMYDPPSGQEEYVEIKNLSGKYLNLQDWQIGDESGSSIISSGTVVLQPNNFIVVSSDTAALFNVYGLRNYVESGGIPSFNNDGDAIKIITNDGAMVDSLQYSGTWGGDNVALERRSDVALSTFIENFGDSPNPNGGTPGIANEVLDDTTPPDLDNLTITNNQTLDLDFSERLASGTATNTGNYSLDNSISIASAQQTAGDSVRLSLSSPLQNGTEYQLSISNQQDIFANTAGTIDTTFTFYLITPVDSGDIFINEFMYDPPDGSSEYMELRNPTSQSFDLNGWTINDNTGNRRTITNHPFIVPPDSFVVIAPDNTLLQNNPDITLISMGSRFPSLNNSGDNIVLRDFTGQRLDSLQYERDWGGNQIALERRTTVAKPIQANFANAPNGFGTPGKQNKVPEDAIPPNLAAFSIIDSQTLKFIYTELVDEPSATNINNYTVSGGISVNSATLVGGDTVRIDLSEPMQNNTSYTAAINGVNDVFGNTLTNRDTTFTYFEVSPADSGDIFINEFMYDPASGQTEYIELYNPTSQSLNIQNWAINDNTGSRQIITEAQFIVPPDNFVVIAPDPTLRTNHPNIALVTMGSRFPSLNNSGDDIVLRNQNGQRLDSLRYTSDWGGNEVALERRATNIDPIQANFGDAPNDFGTPGSSNQITPDNEPPVLNSLRILDKTTLQLTFSETISSETATDPNNYAISPSRGIQLISSVQDTVTLFLANELQSEQTYHVTVSGLQDVFGNTTVETTRKITFVSFTDAQPGNIVINEILYSRESAGSPEFIELYNRTDQNFDLTGWKVGDASSTATLDAGIQLRASEYLVITDDASLANVVDNGVFLSNFPSLNDDEDAVYIQTDNSITIDSLFYTVEFGGNIDGKSAERKDPGAASNDAANFATNTTDDGSTPGAQNSVFRIDETPPTIVFSRIFPNGDIEVRFSEFIALIPDLAFTVGDQTLDIDEFDPAKGNVIFLNAPPDLAPVAPATASETRTSLIITAQNLSDVRGNVTLSVQQPVSRTLLAGDVIINEILFDPLSDSDDNQPDQAEYIELRNIRDYAISLENITLHDAPDEDGNVRTLTPVSTRSKFIPAQGTALIYAEDEIALFSQSRVAQFFNLQDSEPNSIIRIDRSSLSLASTDDAIFLTGNEGTKIDSVYFDESWHNPNIVDTDGVALERINPFGPSNSDANWGSSTNEKGGTPSRENTLFQAPGDGGQRKVGISFTPNPFSPDNDGTDDNLFINYKLDQPDYLMTVHIYDRYGRLVRELADSKQAGLQGSLIWDGRKDNGTRNRIGIYIVIFKAFDSAGGDNKAFKKTVVLARRLN